MAGSLGPEAEVEVVEEEISVEVAVEETVEVAVETVEAPVAEVEVEVVVVEEVVVEAVELSPEVAAVETDSDLVDIIENSNAPEAIVDFNETPVAEETIEEETLEVDLDSIVPVSPELTLPSSEEKKDFSSQLEDALVNILNQRKR